MVSCFYSYTSIGYVTVCADECNILRLNFGKRSFADVFYGENRLIRCTVVQLREYLRGCRRSFDVPISAAGTEFQRRVWKELMQIPYGETRSYKEVACSVGNVRACRAVGMANHQNPIAIIIPCHRVISYNGMLGGYGGGQPIKQFLLNLEQRN